MKRHTGFVRLLAIGGVIALGMSNAGQAAAQTQQRAVDAPPADADDRLRRGRGGGRFSRRRSRGRPNRTRQRDRPASRRHRPRETRS